MLLKFILLLTIFGYSTAIAQSNDEKRRIIESLAKPLDEEIVFYRWQSLTAGDKLISEKTFTDKLYQYFMGMTPDPNHFVAGLGIYAAENPHSSSRFIRGDGEGSLIEVVVEKGSKYIDITDSKMVLALKAKGISVSDIINLNAKVAVKYDAKEKWWVLKSQNGVSFRPFEAKNLRTEYLLDLDSHMETDKAKKIYRAELKKILTKRIEADPQVLNASKLNIVFTDEEISKIKFRNLDFSSRQKLQEIIKSLNQTGSMTKYILLPNEGLMFMESMNKHLRGSEISLELDKATPAAKARMTDYLSQNGHPKKYLDYLSKTNETISPERSLKLGVVPESSVGTGMTPELKAMIEKERSKLLLSDDQLKIFISNPDLMNMTIDYAAKTGRSSWINGLLLEKIPEIKDPRKLISLLRSNVDDAVAVRVLERLSKLDLDHNLRLFEVNRGIDQLLSTKRDVNFTIKILDLAKKIKASSFNFGYVLQQATTPQEFNTLINESLKFKLSDFSSRFDRDRAFSNGLREMLKKNPSVSDITDFMEMMRKNRIGGIVPQFEDMLMATKNPNDFFTVLSESAKYDVKSGNLSYDFRKGVNESMKHFLTLNPSLEEMKKVLALAKSKEWGWVTANMKGFLTATRNSGEFLEIVKSFDQLGSYFNGDEAFKYKTAVIDNVSIFKNGSPTSGHISAMIQIAEKWKLTDIAKTLREIAPTSINTGKVCKTGLGAALANLKKAMGL